METIWFQIFMAKIRLKELRSKSSEKSKQNGYAVISISCDMLCCFNIFIRKTTYKSLKNDILEDYDNQFQHTFIDRKYYLIIYENSTKHN